MKVRQSITINAQNFDTADMFYFDLNFDNSILPFDKTSLNGELLLVDADISMFEGLEVAHKNRGLSFDFTDSVMSVTGNFMLVSFDLIATTEDFATVALVNFCNISIYQLRYYFSGSDSINISAVPEPSSVLMMLVGLL